MICHRRFVHYQIDKFSECLEERCANWNAHEEMCADLANSYHLGEISRYLEKISNLLYDGVRTGKMR